MTPATRPVNGRGLVGAAVGASIGALTIAAHGMGGGAIPDSTALTVLFAICAVAGCLVSGKAHLTLPRLLAVLGGGQVLAHYAIGQLTAAHMPMQMHVDAVASQPAMACAHTVATFGCAGLILFAHRCLTVLGTAVAAVLRMNRAWPRRTQHVTVDSTPVVSAGTHALGPISRRGPPWRQPYATVSCG
ncbi:hypothetical protein FOS14_23160 [Skermania sp. ID1734]|uniref:hypothetical protein n=1 Tax=Skermania sp. ID1734 TaxID=2597516 RepID=UPI00117F944D|nr:hypothetical protein [Skermania sp. ID1734]TSD93454.1 hypothetical protein FOS14_23160 [Skermania sp. ID1734]